VLFFSVKTKNGAHWSAGVSPASWIAGGTPALHYGKTSFIIQGGCHRHDRWGSASNRPLCSKDFQ
jgi:hypothetical protein